MTTKKPVAASDDRSMKELQIALCSSKAKVRGDAARELLKRAQSDPNILAALAQVQPLAPEVAQAFSEKLGSKSYRDASTALGGLIGLPPKLRKKWIPAMLANLKRFRNNSEWCWIVECLPAHYRQYREQIDEVLRVGLKDHYGRYSVMDVLSQIGSAGSALVPDVLAYIGRQKAFTNEEPHLIQLEPKGKTAIPSLIRLLGHRSETVRYQAAVEIAAYGSRARAAVPALTRIIENKDLMVTSVAQDALSAIGGAPR